MDIYCKFIGAYMYSKEITISAQCFVNNPYLYIFFRFG